LSCLIHQPHSSASSKINSAIIIVEIIEPTKENMTLLNERYELLPSDEAVSYSYWCIYPAADTLNNNQLIQLKFIRDKSDYDYELKLHEELSQLNLPVLQLAVNTAPFEIKAEELRAQAGINEEWRYCIVYENFQRSLRSVADNSTEKLRWLNALCSVLSSFHAANYCLTQFRSSQLVELEPQSFKLILNSTLCKANSALNVARMNFMQFSPELAHKIIKTLEKQGITEQNYQPTQQYDNSAIIAEKSADIWLLGVTCFDLLEAPRRFFSCEVHALCPAYCHCFSTLRRIIRADYEQVNAILHKETRELLENYLLQCSQYDYDSLEVISTVERPEIATLGQLSFWGNANNNKSTKSNHSNISGILSNLEATNTSAQNLAEQSKELHQYITESLEDLNSSLSRSLHTMVELDSLSIPQFFILLPDYSAQINKAIEIEQYNYSTLNPSANRVDLTALTASLRTNWLARMQQEINKFKGEAQRIVNNYSPYNYFRLFWLCQHGAAQGEACCHYKHNGYAVKQAGKFLTKAQPLLSALSTALKVASLAGKCAGYPIPSSLPFLEELRANPQAVAQLSAFFEENSLQNPGSNRSGGANNSDKGEKEAFYAAYAALQDLLAENQIEDKTFGGLQRVISKQSGRIMWVCREHSELSEEYISRNEQQTQYLQHKYEQLQNRESKSAATNHYSKPREDGKATVNILSTSISTENAAQGNGSTAPSSALNDISQANPSQDEMDALKARVYELERANSTLHKEKQQSAAQIHQLNAKLAQVSENEHTPEANSNAKQNDANASKACVIL
jgi:hypothetical protein